MVGNNRCITQVKGASQDPQKAVVGASRSLQDLPRERDAPTTYLQKWDAPQGSRNY